MILFDTKEMQIALNELHRYGFKERFHSETMFKFPIIINVFSATWWQQTSCEHNTDIWSPFKFMLSPLFTLF